MAIYFYSFNNHKLGVAGDVKVGVSVGGGALPIASAENSGAGWGCTGDFVASIGWNADLFERSVGTSLFSEEGAAADFSPSS